MLALEPGDPILEYPDDAVLETPFLSELILDVTCE